MAEFLSIDVAGIASLQAELQVALARLEHPHDLMETLGAVLEAQIGDRFDRKIDPSGVPWAPLADSTRAAYARQDTVRRGAKAGQVLGRGTLLERTRQMRNSLDSQAGDSQVEVGMNRLTDNGRWSIPLLHETGTAHMPRRGIFLADPDAGALGQGDEAALQAAVVAFMDDVFGNGVGT